MDFINNFKRKKTNNFSPKICSLVSIKRLFDEVLFYNFILESVDFSWTPGSSLALQEL